jgi:hypothetical protein
LKFLSLALTRETFETVSFIVPQSPRVKSGGEGFDGDTNGALWENYASGTNYHLKLMVAGGPPKRAEHQFDHGLGPH